ncbi:HD domain-containing protein [Sulfurimonas sp.]|uniref:HD domain-containing protein n=1 Tax=Sulfurimonas sp. TaxID=2022749 RepID=UPI002AAF2025|nr:HD domain-containing protein [Sulfurimonas sp.]
MENIKEPFIQELHNELSIDEKLLLKIVVLLHDTGKGRKQDHSEVGAKLILPFATKLHLSQALIERAILLVKYHVLMSNVAFKENIYNEKTLYKFMSSVKDIKNLRLLYILTYADINGVSETTYNSFNSKLLHDLYTSALEVSQNSDRITDASKRIAIEKRVKNSKEFKELPKDLQAKLLRVESNLFFFKHTILDLVRIAKKAKNTSDYSYLIHRENSLSIEIYRRVPLNVGYLLATLRHLDVASMEIFTLFDDLKYFKIEFIKNVDGDELKEVQELVKKAFDMKRIVKLKEITIKREEIIIDCEHSLTHAEVKVNTKNQIGLLAYIMDIFEKLDINIVTAKIHSTKHKVRDSFLMEKQNDICNNVDKIYELLTKDSK